MKLMLRRMEKQEGGYILNVASSAGLLPAGLYMAAYYATKAYIASLTRAVALELKQRGSRVCGGIMSQSVNTEFNAVANVEFALAGITRNIVLDMLLKQMKRRKVVIVPTLTLKAVTTCGRFIPQKVLIAITAHQQKKSSEQRIYHKMEEIKIGSHVRMAGKEMFLASVKEAESYGANVLMLYTGAPQNTRRKEIKRSEY